MVNFASEAGLAVLVALRYLTGDPRDAPDDYVLGWTEIDMTPERVPEAEGEHAVADALLGRDGRPVGDEQARPLPAGAASYGRWSAEAHPPAMRHSAKLNGRVTSGGTPAASG